MSIVGKIEKDQKESIFVENDGLIYEFKMTFDHMDIVNAIEEYIDLVSIHNLEVKSEEMIAEEGMFKKFFPYVGKFRLDGKIKETNNYFVPEETRLLKTLFSIYKSNALEETDFLYIDYLHNSLYQLQDFKIKKVITDFLNKGQIKLLNKYSLEELSYDIECLVKIKLDFEITKTYSSVRDLLEVSKQNKLRVERLGFLSKLIEVINHPKTSDDKEFGYIVEKSNEPFYKSYHKA